MNNASSVRKRIWRASDSQGKLRSHFVQKIRFHCAITLFSFKLFGYCSLNVGEDVVKISRIQFLVVIQGWNWCLPYSCNCGAPGYWSCAHTFPEWYGSPAADMCAEESRCLSPNLLPSWTSLLQGLFRCGPGIVSHSSYCVQISLKTSPVGLRCVH